MVFDTSYLISLEWSMGNWGEVIKHNLKQIPGNLTFTYEELNTLLIQIESIPYTELKVLIPTHLLIWQSLTFLPERKLNDLSINRLAAYQQISKIK